MSLCYRQDEASRSTNIHATDTQPPFRDGNSMAVVQQSCERSDHALAHPPSCRAARLYRRERRPGRRRPHGTARWACGVGCANVGAAAGGRTGHPERIGPIRGSLAVADRHPRRSGGPLRASTQGGAARYGRLPAARRSGDPGVLGHPIDPWPETTFRSTAAGCLRRIAC